MMHKAVALILTLTILMASVAWGQSSLCGYFDTVQGPFYYGNFSTRQHVNGAHAWQAVTSGTCSYEGNNGPCAVESASGVGVAAGDQGQLRLSDCCYHVPGVSTFQGLATSNGGSATSGSEAAAAFMDCLTSGCGVNVSISGSGDGLGLSVSFPPGNIFNDKFAYTNNCAAQYYSGGTGAPGCHCPDPTGCASPVIIDTTGGGFQFSNPKNSCVLFDIDDNNKPVCLSWPIAGSGNAWLVLPDKKGHVSSSRQLFGNHTPQPHHKSQQPNGFLALAEYDANQDLVIDARDPVWPRLRLWIDTHCAKSPKEVCTALPSELHALSEFGIENLGLVYSGSNKTDAWGNIYKFSASLNVNTQGQDRQHSADRLNRTMYDVYLATDQRAIPLACTGVKGK